MNENLHEQIEIYFEKYPLLYYKKRVLILHPNDTPSSVFYIKSGYIKVFSITEDGEELTLTILKPRDFFPLTYGINKIMNSYYLEAITPLEVWRAPQNEFITFLSTNPNIYYDLTTKILIRFDGVLSRMEYLVLSNAYIKIATTILACAKRFGRPSGDNDLIIDVPLTHHDIASLVGITRETTSLELKKLEREGHICKSGRLLIVKKVKLLEDKIIKLSQEEALLAYSF